MRKVLLASASLFMIAFSNVAFAQTPRAKSVAIPAADLTSTFAGKTYAFKEKKKHTNIRWYLSADGKMTGYADDGPSFASGSWTVTDGKLCVSAHWAGSWGEGDSTDCQAWSRDEQNPKKTYRAELDKGGDFAPLTPQLADGDTISAKIAALKKKTGK